MSYWVRQIAAMLFQGDVEADEASKEMWKFQDVPWRVKLILATGKTWGAKFLIPPNTTKVLSLPQQYDPLTRLFCLFSANGTVRLDITPVGESVYKELLRGSLANPGISCFDDRVDTISVVNPSMTDSVYFEYSTMEIPDLNDPLSYREGEIVLGVS